MSAVKKYVVPFVILALLAAMVLVFTRGEDSKRLTAHFPRTVSVYEGSDVRVLGVAIGKVLTVTPSGTDVEVVMEYDAAVDIPDDAEAVIIAPSIVGDRYIQLTPVFTEGDRVLADGAELATDRTSVPLELDQIYSSLNDLNIALGPQGANKKGALNDLLQVTAENFAGEGEQLNKTIKDFGKFSATLDHNKEELFGAAADLQGFIGTLAENDKTVRRFNDSMAELSTMLEGERDELAAALRNLATAMTEVSTFVKDNKDALGRNIRGLNRVSKVLVKQRDALTEVMRVAPVALNNLGLTYNPQAGTLDTRSNLDQIGGMIGADPATFLCSVVNQGDKSGKACDLVQEAFPRAAYGSTGGAHTQDQFDASLGGLVEVDR